MPGADINLNRFVSRLLPAAPKTDQAVDAIQPRGSPYGELVVLNPVPDKKLLADEGSYLVFTNPTPGTALAYPVTTAFADTACLVYIQNNDKLRNLWLDYIKVIVNTAAASGVQAYMAAKLDQAPRTFSTDNTTALTAVNTNSGVANPSNVLVKAQSSATASALSASSGAAKLVSRASTGGITIVGDELVYLFGSADTGAYPGLTAAQAVAPGRKVSVCSPVCIQPGHCFTAHVWFPSNATTGLSYELEGGAILR